MKKWFRLKVGILIASSILFVYEVISNPEPYVGMQISHLIGSAVGSFLVVGVCVLSVGVIYYLGKIAIERTMLIVKYYTSKN